ncbi:hypothetical protein [Ferruginibacter sp.]
MSKCLLFVILCFILNQLNAQEKVLPAEAKPFVLKGYEMLDYVTGDLNADGKADAILILKVTGEDTATEDVKRPMFLLIRKPDGKLKLEKRNDSAIMCRSCGGVFGDPYEGLSIENNGFSIDFYGGSNWRWYYHYYFTYKPATKNWMLVKEENGSFQSTDPEKDTEDATIDATELGDVTFEKFNSSPEYVEAEWKVTAAKTFFYNNPKLGSKPRKGYLLKGDIASQIRELQNFVQVSFKSSNDKYIHGYILKKDLVKVTK